MYIMAPFDSEGKPLSYPLPALRSMNELKGYMCSECVYASREIRHIQENMRATHEELNESIIRTRIDGIVWSGYVYLQSLQGGSKRRYFKVFYSDNYTRTQELTLPSHPPSPVHPLTEATFQFEDLFSEDQFEPIQNEQGNVADETICNDFIALNKIREILTKGNIRIEQALKLSGIVAGKTIQEKEVLVLAKFYLLVAYERSLDAAPSFLEYIYPKEGTSFGGISKRSSDIYAGFLSRLVLSLSRFCEEGFLHIQLTTLVFQLENVILDRRDDEEKMKALHSLVKCVCLVYQDLFAGVCSLFVRTLIACACVLTSRKGDSVSYRFSEAQEISHLLAAMQHFIMCCAIWEMDDIHREMNVIAAHACSDLQNHDSPATDKDILQERENVVMRTMDRSANTAISFVRNILSSCMKISKSRTVDISVDCCNEDQFCGFVRGLEISMGGTGVLIRKWQLEAREIMMKELLFDNALPAGFMTQIHGLEDNLSEKASGFFFLNHPSCKQHLTKWNAYVLQAIAKYQGSSVTLIVNVDTENGADKTLKSKRVVLADLQIHRDFTQKWLRASQLVLKKLLLCIHLSSGSPARGTEIATYRLQNGLLGTRNVFISQGEVVLICKYSKNRALKR